MNFEAYGVFFFETLLDTQAGFSISNSLQLMGHVDGKITQNSIRVHVEGDSTNNEQDTCTHTQRNARARMHITTYMTMNCYGDQKEHLAMVLVHI